MYRNISGFTLSGMYNYFDILKEKEEATGLFDDMELFEGGTFYEQEIDAIDPEIVEGEIMERYGELITYRQIPTRFKSMLNLFFKKNYKNFAKMQIALQMDFNPIYNYDRYEESRDINSYNSNMTKSGSESDSGDTTLTKSGAETHKIDNSTGSFKVKETVPETTTNLANLSSSSNGVKYHGVSAYNLTGNVTDTSSYSPESMDYETITPSKTEVIQGSNPGETSYSGVGYEVDIYGRDVNAVADRKDKTEVDMAHEYNNVRDAHSGHDDLEHSAHMYGNIGVTTSTAMIKEVLEVYDFDLYKFIADKFANELLILIY